jgi:lysophospholipase L1-like esterase
MSKLHVHITIFFCGLVLPVLSYPQEADYYIGNEKFSFIAYDKNYFIIPPSDSSFLNLYNQFDSLIAFGKGKIQIVHLGGSHIQADIYTHVIRRRMQEMSPDMNGGRGLIFPVTITHSNNPKNFGVRYTGTWNYCLSTMQNESCSIGITGMSVTTTDTDASITIIPNRDSAICYTYNQVRIFHEPTLYHLYIDLPDTLIYGYYDSLCGCSVFKSDRLEDTLRIGFNKDSIADAFTLQGISLDSDAPGLVYNAIGVNGAMLSSYLNCKLYSMHLKSLSPNLIIFSIGTNDAYTRKFEPDKFRNEYAQLIRTTRETAPEAAILLTVPNDSYLYKRYVNGNTEKMRETIYTLAEQFCCGVWDFYSIMGGLNSSMAWRSVNLMQADKIHFTNTGYELKGELFFSAFLKGWEQQLNGFELRSGINQYNRK